MITPVVGVEDKLPVSVGDEVEAVWLALSADCSERALERLGNAAVEPLSAVELVSADTAVARRAVAVSSGNRENFMM